MQGRLVETVVLVGRRAILVAGLCVALAAQVAAQTFTVNTAADELGLGAGNGRCETAPGNGRCTFRRALWEASTILTASAPSQRPAITVVLDVPGALVTLARQPVANVLAGFGSFAAWLLDGSSIVNGGDLIAVSDAWRLSDVVDTDGDGRADLVWRGTDGTNARWRMDGLTLLGVEFMPTVPDSLQQIN
jgi:hypothetical protein